MTARLSLMLAFQRAEQAGFGHLARALVAMLRAEDSRGRKTYGRVMPDGSAFAAVERPAVSMTEDR